MKNKKPEMHDLVKAEFNGITYTGTVVHKYEDDLGYEVEVRDLGVLTCREDQVRRVTRWERFMAKLKASLAKD